MTQKASTPKTAKSAVGKSPSKPKESKDPDLRKQLLFLWTCHKVSDVHIDIAAVAKHLGIKNNAALMRFTRLKKKLEALEAMEGSSSTADKKTKAKPTGEDQGEDDVQIKDEHCDEP